MLAVRRRPAECSATSTVSVPGLIGIIEGERAGFSRVPVAGSGARRHRERIGSEAALPVIFCRSLGEGRVRVGAPVLTVGNDAWRVERMLEEGGLSCPGCGGRLAGWRHGRQRAVFGPGRRTRRMVRPRRSRCMACGVTHMLLPASGSSRPLPVAAILLPPPASGADPAVSVAASRCIRHRRAARRTPPRR